MTDFERRVIEHFFSEPKHFRCVAPCHGELDANILATHVLATARLEAACSDRDSCAFVVSLTYRARHVHQHLGVAISSVCFQRCDGDVGNRGR